MDFRKSEQVVESMRKLRVPVERLPILGGIKLLAVAGLLVGFQNNRLAGITGLCLCLYFALAVTTHTRVKDSLKETFPAFALLVVSALFVLTTVGQ
jgi:NaMN:DMB phosphoribosyltransferase